ncbi:MAG: sulfite exporter TauE/SafE family protein [Candidatus Fimenecus sp.]
MKKISLTLLGVLVGIINILLGAGGGILAVPILKKCGCDQKQAQANAVAVILPLTIFSFIIYAKQDYVNFFQRIWIVPFAAVGAVLGTLVFRKLSSNTLRKVFAVFMIWAGARMLWNL